MLQTNIFKTRGSFLSSCLCPRGIHGHKITLDMNLQTVGLEHGRSLISRVHSGLQMREIRQLTCPVVSSDAEHVKEAEKHMPFSVLPQDRSQPTLTNGNCVCAKRSLNPTPPPRRNSEWKRTAHLRALPTGTAEAGRPSLGNK